MSISFDFAGIAQLVERNLAKVEVASSRLVSRSTLRWRGGRVVMQRPAKPWTPVRFRPPPPSKAQVVKQVDTTDLKSVAS